MARRTYVISVKKPKCKLLLQRQNYAIHDFFIYKVHIRNTGGQNERKRRWCDQKNGYNTTSKGVSERSDTFLKIHNNCQNGKYLDLCRLT